MLAHCWSNVPFLERRWRAAGLSPAPLARVADLRRYPTIDKQTITENFAEMRARGWEGRALSKSTGGSTGDPFRFEYSQESYARRIAVMWRGYRWCGADLGRRTAYLWGSGAPASGLHGSKERLYHAAFNRLFLSAFEMTDANLASYVERIDRFRPRVLVGYVAPLALLAQWMVENGVAIRSPQTIITGAESLTAPQRELISRAFGAPAFNTYGCREVMLLASECSLRNGLHVSADHLIVEALDDSRDPVTGESGDVCITDLHNYAMPFVRYINGDRATPTARPCPCGRGLPLLESIDGRLLDMIRTADGRAMPGEFFVHMMLDFPQVRFYQVVQNSLDEVELRIVPRTALDEQTRLRLERKMISGIGERSRVKISEVRAIPLTPSGKRRITISNLT